MTEPDFAGGEQNYYPDFEFNEDGVTIEPISLGMVSDDDRELYLEFQFDEPRVCETNPWVAENVVPLLTWPKSERLTFKQAREKIVEFVCAGEAAPVFWAYFADYDWVCLCRLFGKMIDLPSYFPKYCMDLQQSYKMLGSPAGVKPPKPDKQHNALVDSRWNRQLHRVLQDLWTDRLARKPDDEFRSGLRMILDLESDATDQQIWEAASSARAVEANDLLVEVRNVMRLGEGVKDADILIALQKMMKHVPEGWNQ